MAYKFKPPVNTQPITTNVSNKNGIVYRIRKIVEPTLILDELSFPISQADKDAKYKQEDRASVEFPLVKINDYIFASSEIISLEINCVGFLPTISLTVRFEDRTFINKEMPKDGDIISIAIRNKNDTLHPIRNDYVIIGTPTMNVSTTIKSGIIMTLFGELFIPGLKSTKRSYAFKNTSFEAIKQMAKNLNIGFATNEDGTNDTQIWLCANQTPENFIKKTTECAWKDSNSFFDSWIDIYYCLNFVNVNKQLLSSESNIDSAVHLNAFDKDYFGGLDSNQNNTIETVKVFSNMSDYISTPFYITSWKPINKSSQITFLIGTRTFAELFQHNQKIYATDASKYWSLDMDPIYDPQKLSDHIILRGRTIQDKIKSGDKKQTARANYSYPEIYEKHPWLGIQYTLSNPNDDNKKWDGNHHANYLRARVFNLINNKELDKLNLEINTNGINLNILRGDKLPIIIMERDPVVIKKINPEAQTTETKNYFYSGWYYVKGFNISWNTSTKDKESQGIPPQIISNFSHSFILTRREWPAPVPIEPLKEVNKIK